MNLLIYSDALSVKRHFFEIERILRIIKTQIQSNPNQPSLGYAPDAGCDIYRIVNDANAVARRIFC